jgi:hypothetical protein
VTPILCYHPPMGNLKVETGDSGGLSPSRYWKEPRLAKIDIHNDDNVNFWCSELNITRERLLIAVKDFGSVIRDIRRGLAHDQGEAA